MSTEFEIQIKGLTKERDDLTVELEALRKDQEKTMKVLHILTKDQKETLIQKILEATDYTPEEVNEFVTDAKPLEAIKILEDKIVMIEKVKKPETLGVRAQPTPAALDTKNTRFTAGVWDQKKEEWVNN